MVREWNIDFGQMAKEWKTDQTIECQLIFFPTSELGLNFFLMSMTLQNLLKSLVLAEWLGCMSLLCVFILANQKFCLYVLALSTCRSFKLL